MLWLRMFWLFFLEKVFSVFFFFFFDFVDCIDHFLFFPDVSVEVFVFWGDGDVVWEDFSVGVVEEEDLFEFGERLCVFVEVFEEFGGVVENEEIFEFGDDSAFFVEDEVVGVDLVEDFCG